LSLDAANRQARTLDRVDHRPWPVPDRGWSVAETREDVLFAHWRVSRDELRPHVPPALELDTHGGDAWLGIAAFRITGLRLRGLPPLPGVSSFLGVSVRAYVSAGGDKPGVHPLSLDASSRLAVAAARRAYRLAAFHARMSALRRGEWTEVECARVAEPGRVLSARCRPSGAALLAKAGSFEAFFSERYCSYTAAADGTILRAELHHEPWALEPAEAEIGLVSVAPLVPAEEPTCHVSRRQDVLLWPAEPIG
jgi:uncharacterized protein YqjF (DUF2071 family)